MARRKKDVGCLGILLLWPFYFIWYLMVFAFTLTWEMIKFPYTLAKGMSKRSYKRKTKGVTWKDYESFAIRYLRSCGYSNVHSTRGNGGGAAITATKGIYKYAVQCKYYSAPVGIEAVQQVIAGMVYCNCDKAVVISNNTFTEPAKKLAAKSGVKLIPYIEIGHINGFYTLRSVLTIIFSLLMIGMIVSINGTGLRNIPSGYVRGYLAIAVTFLVLVSSYILPKAVAELRLKRIQRDLHKVEQGIEELERHTVHRR